MKHFRPEIDRGPLQQLLLDSLQPDTLVWNRQFKALSTQGDSWKIEFQNDTFTIADLVIAGDGANSKIRPYITPINPLYAGIMVVEGAVYNSEKASPQIHAIEGMKNSCIGRCKNSDRKFKRRWQSGVLYRL